MKRVVAMFLLLITGLAAVLVARAAMVSEPVADSSGAVASGPAIDSALAAQRLSGAVKFATISYASGAPIDTAAFLGFHDFLVQSFPQVHTGAQA